MKTKILFVERKPSKSVSIEKVFRQIAKNLSGEKYATEFEQLVYDNNLLGTLKNLLFYKKSKADIYHITGHVHYIALILPKNRTVLTVHDLGILHIRKGIRRYILKKLLFDLPVKKLKYITAVSETTKQEIIKYTNCSDEKIKVIENPLREDFYLAEKKTFNKRQPTILQIGTTYNKNIKNVAKALNGINCQFRIIGELDAETVEILQKNRINYQNKLDLNDSEIRNEYLEADIVTFCSTFEGFGLPIIEAQAMQTPVITSNINPMKEVAGNFAALADPNDVEGIRRGILEIINDDSYRNKLIESGAENVRRFRAEPIAVLYENLYEQIKSDLSNT
jgi:glycosyltransferase involved in cell wall biosynthesis